MGGEGVRGREGKGEGERDREKEGERMWVLRRVKVASLPFPCGAVCV